MSSDLDFKPRKQRLDIIKFFTQYIASLFGTKLYIVCNLIHFLSTAYLSDIVAQGDTAVEFGQDASFSCALSEASGVKQVTWQRVRDTEPVQTLATFSDLFKDHVDDQYVGKVFFTAASVNSTSIEIKNTTFEDEACYICSFKVYPFQPKRQTLCLAVKGKLNTCYNHESHKAFL